MVVSRYWVSSLAIFALTASAAPMLEYEGRDHALATLLLSQSDQDIRAAARSLDELGSERQDIFDVVAEIAWAGCSGNQKMDSDTLSWLVKSLGNTKKTRYAGVLDYCLAHVSDDKTKKYTKLARGNISGETAASFDAGKTDLVKMRAELSKKVNGLPREQLAKRFNDLHGRQTMEDTYAALGKPDAVSSLSVPGKKVGHGFVKIRTYDDIIVLTYSGLGTIRFDHKEGQTDWILTEARSDKGLIWSGEEKHFVILNDQIDKGNGSQLREIAQALIDQDAKIGRDVLDRVATRISRSQNESEESLVDGLAWLCKVLTKSGDGRYKQFLLDVSNNAAANKKLKAYAAKSAKALPDTTEAKFVSSDSKN